MNFASINFCDVINGKGIRISVFLSGCNFHCPECFNPECQNFSYGKPFTEQIENLILEKLNDTKISGVSFLGGDPLCQNEEGLKQLAVFCSKIHSMGKDVWLWSGYRYEELQEDNSSIGFLRKVVLNNVDVFIDGRYHKDEKDLSLPFRGSSNQKIWDLRNENK